MSVKKRGLGRGLSDLGLNELLSKVTQDNRNLSDSEITDSELKQLPLDVIEPGKYQPRRGMDQATLQELADSIRSQGIIQPIVVREVAANRYEIVAGERRWRATRLAGLTKIPAIVKKIADNNAIAMALIENIQRENLNAIEEAIALQQLNIEFSLTHQQIAEIVGKSRASISNLLRLLNLPTEIKHLVEVGELEMGHARALLSLDEERQHQVANTIVLKKLSVRETELHIRRLLNLSDIPEPKIKDPEINSLERSLSKRLGLRVSIKSKEQGKGKVILHYRNQEQLQAVLTYLENETTK